METAKEMFEELELYAYQYTDTMWEDVLEYSNKSKTTYIKFYLRNRLFEVKTEHGFSHLINMPLLEAINKQVEELKWN